MRRPRPLVLAARVAAATPLIAAPAHAESTGDTVLSVGHTDALSVHYENDALKLKVKDDTGSGSVYRDPADVTFQVLPRAAFPIPELPPSYDFLGEEGETVWLLPLVQDHDLLWPGWSTESLPTGAFKGDKVAMSLVGVEGPGEVKLWTTDSFGNPQVTFDSEDGLPDALDVSARVHAHSYWAFTATGSYTLTWQVTGTTAAGNTVSTGTVDYSWVVGDLPQDPPDPPTGPTVLSVGHTDAISVHLENGALTAKVKDDTAGETRYHDPADVIFQIREHADLTLDENLAFLGETGDVVWNAPDQQDPTVLWPGYSTQTLTKGTFTGDRLRLSLVGFDGPGDFVMHYWGDTGPVVNIDTRDGLNDAFELVMRSHGHRNWTFTERGEYTLAWRVTGSLVDGTPVDTGAFEQTWVVGDELPAGTPPQLRARVDGMAADYRPGDTVTLTAVPENGLVNTHVYWYRKCPGALAAEQILDELAMTYAFTATDQLDGCRYLAQLRSGQDVNVISTAATLHVSGNGSNSSQSIVATVDPDAGGLVVSVDPDDRTADLGTAELAATADRWEATGALRPVTVTDTRMIAAPGWNVSGQVLDFLNAEGDQVTADHLGWAPTIASQGQGQGAVPGDPIASALDGGPGLAGGATLASAPPGAGLGTAVLGADLTLLMPTTTYGGTYRTTLTLTII